MQGKHSKGKFYAKQLSEGECMEKSFENISKKAPMKAQDMQTNQREGKIYA